MDDQSLYARLGGYDAVRAVVNDFIPRLQGDEKLGRFWAHRGKDGIEREKQLLVDFLCSAAGGNMYYTGRDMKLSHEGMRIDQEDWKRLKDHLLATLTLFNVPDREVGDVMNFIESTQADIVEV